MARELKSGLFFIIAVSKRSTKIKVPEYNELLAHS